MYNNFKYNGNVYNAIVEATQVIRGIIIYNLYVLHKNDDVYISQADFYNAPRTEVKTFNNPERNWMGLLDYKHTKGILQISWTIKKDTPEKMREEIDKMKKSLYQPNKTLQVIFDWEIRKNKAYIEDLQFAQKSYTTNFIKFTARFATINPYWEKIGGVSNTFWDITDTLQESEINDWSAITYPKFIFTFYSASSVSNISLEMWDTAIVINESINADDIVIIDSIEQTVKVNDEEVNFDWVLPIMEVWANPYTLTVDWTYNLTSSVQYNLRFI